MVITPPTSAFNAKSAGRTLRPANPLLPEPLAARAHTRMLAVCGLAIAAGSPLAQAETWRISPSIAVESTLTDNVDLTAHGTADWVNQFTPAIAFQERGAHTQLNGAIAVPILLYARTSAENNQVFPQVNINGSYEAIDKLLFVDAFASVSQQFQTPFGPRSTSLANATQNRYTAQSYGVSPYVRSVLPGGLEYELRDNNTWSNSNASSIASGQSYTNEIIGHISSRPTPAGWSLEYDRADIRFSGQPSEITELARMRGSYRIDASLVGSVSAGYEDDRFFLTRERGTIYGAGIVWRPSDRTTLNADWEHRFFGTAYDVAFNHTSRLTVWSVSAARNIESYPQQLASLGQGGNVSQLLNSLFASRITDPIARQTFVDQLIRDRGLPALLSGAVPLLAQQVTLTESANATAGILGARNSILFTVFRSRNEPLPGEELAGLLSDQNNNTQIGASAAWTHQLKQNLVLATTFDWSRTSANVQSGESTRLYSLRAFLSTSLSALTSVYGGVRYQDSRSDIGESFREAALFVGLIHMFH